MDNFKTIHRILCYLEEAMDYDAPDMALISPEAFGITRQRWSAIMTMLIDEQYISGLTAVRSASGTVTVLGNMPRITLRGLEYLQQHNKEEHHGTC